MPRPRRREERKLGRFLWGTSQMRLNAFCVAPVMPMPASSEPTMPIASATPLPFSACSLSESERIGNCPSVPCTIFSWSLGCPCRTKPRIVTNTSSSGKSETNA